MNECEDCCRHDCRERGCIASTKSNWSAAFAPRVIESWKQASIAGGWDKLAEEVKSNIINRNHEMKVTINKPVDVELATMDISLKVRDDFSYKLLDTNGNTILEQDEGYVPAFVPGDYGDYMQLVIDVRTGQIINWPGQDEFKRHVQACINKGD